MLDTKLANKKDLNKAIEAYKIVSNFSPSEIETLEILAGCKVDILKSINDSKSGRVSPISSIL